MKSLFFPLFTLIGILAAAAAQPNLLIVSDDQGYNDLGLLGNGIITPALDRLAAEGTRLTSFYVAWPACTPSRASLLTGRYPQRNGIYDMIRNEAPDYGYKYPRAEYEVSFERIGGMDIRERIIPQLLPASYTTGIYGKWDLGTLKRFLPTSRGFDDFYGFVNTGIDYYTHERYGVPSMYRHTERTEEDKGTYCTYLFEREAMRFLEENAGQRAFFLYVAFNAPHNSSALEPAIRTSVQAPDKYKKMYPPVENGTRTVERYKYAERHKWGREPVEVTTSEARQRDYRASVTCMDDSIGKMLDLLDKKGVANNTIVVFLSDNGGSGGADNRPLRGRKAQTWEGGIRVPCIVRWPGGEVPAGSTNDAFLSSLELLPSFAKACGKELPDNIVLDGYNWWPTLRGGIASPRTSMFWKRRDTWGARVNEWKWTVMGENQQGLFHLAEDIGETNDLSQERPDMLRKLQQAYQSWLKQMDEAEPRGPFRNY